MIATLYLTFSYMCGLNHPYEVLKLNTSSNFKSNSKPSLIYAALPEYQTHNLTIEMCA